MLFTDMFKLITNTKNQNKNKELSYFKDQNVNILQGCAFSEKLPLGNFQWVEETSQFSKDFLKSYNDDSDEGYFFEVHVHYSENLYDFHSDLPFLSERMKIEKVAKLVTNLH